MARVAACLPRWSGAECGSVPEAIGGIAGHVHLLIGLRATACIADVVRDVNAVSLR
jgi:hypothetical protein